jgi:hypothetical protein
LFLGFSLATLAHGLYDGFLFEKQWTVFFLPTYLFLIYFQFRLLKLAYAYSQMKRTLHIENLKLLTTDNDLLCCNCRQNKANKYKFEKIVLFVCQTCENTIMHKNEFDKLLKYFRPKLNRKNFFTNLQYLNGLVSLYEKTYYHTKKQRLNADLNNLNLWLTNENKKDIYYYHKGFEGRIFYLLGFKYLKND